MTPPPPTPFRALLLVAGFTAQHIARSRKTIFLTILMLAPAAMALVLRTFARPGEIDLFRAVTPNMYLLGLIQITCLFYGASLVRDGMEDRTLVFMLTRPLGRLPIVFGQYVGMLILIVPLVMVSVLTAFVSARTGLPDGAFGDAEATRGLFLLEGVTTLGVVFYGALYSLFGLLFRWPTLVGLVYFMVVELAFGFLPGAFRNLAPSGYLESLLAPFFETRAMAAGALHGVGDTAPDKLKSWVVLIVSFGAILWLMRRNALRRDFLPVGRLSGD